MCTALNRYIHSPSLDMIITTHEFVPNHMPSSDTRPRDDFNVIPEPESPDHFAEFFEMWLSEQNSDLEALIAALKGKPASISELVGRVMDHYENYYRVKSESVKQDAVRMLTPSWRSHLEDAFLWVGGWRPSMAFHLLYSISGLQLDDLMRGLTTGDLADLSPCQLGRVDELQCRTIKAEKALTETLAAHQETVADSSMVMLSHLATQLTRNPDSVTRTESIEKRVDSVLSGKEEKLVGIFSDADDLRLKTLKNVVGVLSPIQAAHFLISSAELHLRVHEWGKKKDARVNGVVGPRPN